MFVLTGDVILRYFFIGSKEQSWFLLVVSVFVI